MPTKQKPAAAQTPDKSLRSNLTLSIPTALLADVDALAKKVGLSRADVIETILRASTFSDPAPAGPHVCPRGHIRPCDRKQQPVPNPS